MTTSAAVAITVQTAVASAGTLCFIHPDHLDTPRQVSDATGKVVWQWEEQEPFGLIAPLRATGNKLDVAVFVEQLHDLLVAGLSVIEALDAQARGARATRWP